MGKASRNIGGATAREVASALRSPFVPGVAESLAAAHGYLEAVWPQVAPSVNTAGFLGSALYMADMALDAVVEVYEPLLNRGGLLGGALTASDLDQIEAVLDVFHWVQPQLLLVVAALAEAWDRPAVGGQGRSEPRSPSEREAAHLATSVRLEPVRSGLLPDVAEALQLPEAPDLYRAVASWPPYLEAAWDELQHLAAYPQFRRRGRALYFYARSSARFLAQPLEANPEALRARGVEEAALTVARDAIDGALPALATMMMHCTAMRVGLGLAEHEVVGQD